MRLFGLAAAGAVLAGSAAWLTSVAPLEFAAGLGALAMVYAYTVFCAYTRRAPLPIEHYPSESENMS
jgi:hypothetical protein